MAFVRRMLSFKFDLASGSFAGAGSSATFSGLRATAKIIKAGTPSLGTAQLQIWGLPLAIMKQLATLGVIFRDVPPNTVTVMAGDEGGQMSVVFYGSIIQAWGQFEGMPDVPFNVTSQTLAAQAVLSQTPASYTGSTDVATAMGDIAQKAGLTFENNGIDKKIAAPYLWGSARNMADQLAQAAGINWFADDKTLACWPIGGSRGGDTALIAPPPEGAMRGYPTFTAYGVAFQTLYDRSLKFGGKVKIKSSILPASGGPWAIVKLAHDLSTEYPDGDWFSSVEAFDPKFPRAG